MFRKKIELAFECQAPVQVPIEAATEAGVVGSTQVGVCKPHGGKLRAKFKACVVVLGKRWQSAKQREQPEESKIAGNQTKHEAALPLRQARAAESSISYLRITGFSAGTPRFFRLQSSGREMGGAILVIRGEIPVHILTQQVVWRGKANLGWHAAANANLLFLPHPIFQVRHFF